MESTRGIGRLFETSESVQPALVLEIMNSASLFAHFQTPPQETQPLDWTKKKKKTPENKQLTRAAETGNDERHFGVWGQPV